MEPSPRPGSIRRPAAVPANGVTVSALASDGKTMGIVYVNIAPPGPSRSRRSRRIRFRAGSYSHHRDWDRVSKWRHRLGRRRQPDNDLRQRYDTQDERLSGPGAAGRVSKSESRVALGSAVHRALCGQRTSAAADDFAYHGFASTLGATQQFTSSGATSWTATAGTVTTAGLYTAPADHARIGTVTVTATGPAVLLRRR